MPDDLGEIFRREAGRCTATLIRILGDIDLAEDAVAEAFAIAAEQWPANGVPPNPGGWITTTARNRAIDRLRRESSRTERHLAAERLHTDMEPEHDPELDNLDAFVDVVAEQGRMPQEHAEAFMAELEHTENRYRPDVWG
jgi:RNA polymerase sigma-70 factor (ECF subfamily)